MRSSDDEVVAADPALPLVDPGHDQPRVEQRVFRLAGIVRKIDLRREYPSGRTAYPEMIMGGPGGIVPRFDRGKPPAAGGVGELLGAQPVAFVVVIALMVGMPDLDQRAGNQRAIGIDDEASVRLLPPTASALRSCRNGASDL